MGHIVDRFGYTAVFRMMGFPHIVATALVYATVRRRMAGVE